MGLLVDVKGNVVIHLGIVNIKLAYLSVKAARFGGLVRLAWVFRFHRSTKGHAHIAQHVFKAILRYVGRFGAHSDIEY